MHYFIVSDKLITTSLFRLTLLFIPELSLENEFEITNEMNKLNEA